MKLPKIIVSADFNPRTPRGGATSAALRSISSSVISIHAPREGVRHNVGIGKPVCLAISIHAPREGVRL